MADSDKPQRADDSTALSSSPGGVDSTVRLLERGRGGDREALDQLFARYVPSLRRWASGRLPQWARDIADTHDLVQDTVLETFKRIEGFEPRGHGALEAYLRQALLNRIRTEFRGAGRRPAIQDLDSQVEDPGTSPLEAAIGREKVEQYEAALARLKPKEREAIITRVELGLTYQEVAEALGMPSWGAARNAVVRALGRLVEEMGPK